MVSLVPIFLKTVTVVESLLTLSGTLACCGDVSFQPYGGGGQLT